MRVVAGSARGRRLAVPAGRSVRPTSDRMREGLFSALVSLRGPLTGVRVLDLYAGSGAVGLEALSRGAAHVTFVEVDRTALDVLRRNIERVGLAGAVVRGETVQRVLAGPPDPAYDVIFADPPYADPVADVLVAVVPWLARDGVVVVERPTRDAALRWPAGLAAVQNRRYGEGTLWYGRCVAYPEDM